MQQNIAAGYALGGTPTYTTALTPRARGPPANKQRTLTRTARKSDTEILSTNNDTFLYD